jgi:cytochrome P450
MPQDDVISYLVQQRIDDAVISETDVFSIVELLIAGGTGTTASPVGQALVWLAAHEQTRQRLIGDPELLTRAVEEFLRVFLILERMPDYTIDVSGLAPYLHQGTNMGWRRIPARFTPGARRGDIPIRPQSQS